MSLKLNERYPGRFSNPSADYPAGSFKNRTSPVAKDGSYLEKDWANDKEGFFQSIVAAMGAAPNGLVDKVGASQFFDCLLQLFQNQIAQAFPTAGTATALTLTPVPAISAYTANQRFSVKFHVASGANPTLNTSAKGAKALKQYDASGAKVAAAFAVGQISDVVYDGVDFVLIDPLPAAANNLVGVVGAAKNLKVSTTGTSSIVTVSADELVAESATNSYVTLRSVAASLSFAVAGANGLDVGAANSQAASTWYSVWVIWNGSTIAGLLSLSETAPTMPAGYTHKARVGWIRTDSTANKFPLSFVQHGDKAFYVPAAGTNLLSPPSMAAGVLGNVNTPTWSPFSVDAFIPPTASIVKFFTAAYAQAAVYMVADSNAYGVYNSGTNPPPVMHNTASPGADFIQFMSSLRVAPARNLFCASNTAAFNIRCLGWEDNL